MAPLLANAVRGSKNVDLRLIAHQSVSLYDLPQFTLPEDGKMRVWARGREVGLASVCELSFLRGNTARLVVAGELALGVVVTRLGYSLFLKLFQEANPFSSACFLAPRSMSGWLQEKQACSLCRKERRAMVSVSGVMICQPCNKKRKSTLSTARAKRRRILEWKAGDPITEEIRKGVFKRDGEMCRKCGSKERLSIDHIRPLFWHGSNDADNLQALCVSCNSSKAIKSINFRDNPSPQIIGILQDAGLPG